MMALALHTSTTDRLGPALTLAAPGSRLHSDAFSSPSHSGSPLPFVLPVSTKGPGGLPSLGDEPLASELASHHHASWTTAHILSHLSAITCPPPVHAHSQKGHTTWPWDLA